MNECLSDQMVPEGIGTITNLYPLNYNLAEWYNCALVFFPKKRFFLSFRDVGVSSVVCVCECVCEEEQKGQ